MKKYNITVNVLFWVLVSFILLFTSLLIVFSRYGDLDSIIKLLGDKEIPEKEETIISEVKEVEKEIDWFYFVASGYSADDAEQGTDNITATGKEVKEGFIAVDPDIIPLGTEVEIKNMGVFVAEDTGGKIKGNRIDIYFKSKEEAESFGRKGIWIRIINCSDCNQLIDLYGDVPLYENGFQDENMSASRNKYYIFGERTELLNN